MKVLVPVKRVVDPYAKIRVKKDGSGVDTEQVKMAMNPFDEIAVEEALSWKEKGVVTEVVVVSVGSEVCQETLRTGLALGADRAILIEQETNLEPINIASCLRALVLSEKIDLVICGKQSIDGDNNQTGQMLAALLDWPQATFASTVTLTPTTATVVREIDGGLETLTLTLPAVITTDLRLNIPRYATLPKIMQAKKKPLQIIKPSDLGVVCEAHQRIISVMPPPERQGGIRLPDTATLVAKLQEAGVI